MKDSLATTDGRVARGRRTRQAIVDAHTALLREGILKPTGKMIADEAGVSVRSLWLNFKDLEGLLEATTAYWLQADIDLTQRIDAGLPLAERIDLYCAQRAVRMENIGPGARSAALGEPFSAALTQSHRNHVLRANVDVTEAFATELEQAGSDRERLRMAIFLAGGWGAWASMRDDHGLTPQQAEAVVHFTVTRLLHS